MEPSVLRGRVGLTSLKAIAPGLVGVLAEVKLNDGSSRPFLALMGSPEAQLLLKGGDICILQERIGDRLQFVAASVEAIA